MIMMVMMMMMMMRISSNNIKGKDIHNTNNKENCNNEINKNST